MQAEYAEYYCKKIFFCIQKIMTNYNPHSNIKVSSISSCTSPNSTQLNSTMLDDWERLILYEQDHTMFKQILHKFKGDIKFTLSHLTTVHNETCGCQIGSSSHAEMTNKIWNQKKVSFMELQKQSGLDFDDYLNRVLRLLVDNNIQNVQPLPESEFWQTLQQTSFCQPKVSNGCHQPMEHCNQATIEEDLADIQRLIANDIGAESSQNFFLQQPSNHQSSLPASIAPQTSNPNLQSLHQQQQSPITSTCQFSNHPGEAKHNLVNSTDARNGTIHASSFVPLVKYCPTEQKILPKLEVIKSTPQVKLEVDAASVVCTSNNPYFNFEYADPLNGIDELARLKRKEKHKAPIDCSGISEAFGYTWFCKMCNLQHSGKHECVFYRNFHHPKYILKNSPFNDRGLPRELIHFPDGASQSFARGKARDNNNWSGGGIYTGSNGLRAFTRLGPLRGRECSESEIDFDEDRSRVWLVYCENGTRKCIVTPTRNNTESGGDEEREPNWMANVTPAETALDANVLIISSGSELFLVTSQDIPPHTQLRYFSKEDPTTEFWTSWTRAWGGKQKRCSRCSIHAMKGSQLNSVADYRVHIALWHDLSFSGNPQNRIYYCPDCGVKKIGAKEIVSHCRTEHNSFPFLCKKCGRRFETYNSLAKHKSRIHTEEKPMKKSCEKCGKVYLDPKALKQHIKQVHEKSEQLHCVDCEFIFSSKYALSRHVKEVHNRRQEHTCPKCSKQFTQQSNLKQHMLIHIGAKPFPCADCKSAFTTKQCLQVHYRKVHHYNDDAMPPIHREKSLDEYCNDSNANITAENKAAHGITVKNATFPLINTVGTRTKNISEGSSHSNSSSLSDPLESSSGNTTTSSCSPISRGSLTKISQQINTDCSSPDNVAYASSIINEPTCSNVNGVSHKVNSSDFSKGDLANIKMEIHDVNQDITNPIISQIDTNEIDNSQNFHHHNCQIMESVNFQATTIPSIFQG